MGTTPFNCNFNDRQSAQLYITVDSEDKRFEQLAVNAFNADRKRMSVLVREVMPGGNGKYVFCYTIVLPSFLVCDVSLSPSYPSITACLYSLTRHEV